jgi:hypothetical protein
MYVTPGDCHPKGIPALTTLSLAGSLATAFTASSFRAFAEGLTKHPLTTPAEGNFTSWSFILLTNALLASL